MKFEQRFIRFIFVGILNTLFGLGVYTLLLHLSLPIWGALIGGSMAGMAFNFITTGHLIFAKLSLSRFPYFVAAYLGINLINYVSIRILLIIHLGPIMSQTILTPIVAALSYYIMSKHVFNDASVENRQ